MMMDGSIVVDTVTVVRGPTPIRASVIPGRRAPTYEQRITQWVADSGDEAFLLAEEEARTYADSVQPPGIYLGFAQYYWFDDEPGAGAELFSLMRQSQLGADDYVRQLFVAGSKGRGTRRGLSHLLSRAGMRSAAYFSSGGLRRRLT
jgi:hypothetical protein